MRVNARLGGSSPWKAGRRGVTTFEYLVAVSLIALGLFGAQRVLQAGVERAADAQVRALALWIDEGRGGARPGGAVPELQREEPAAAAAADEGGGFEGFVSGAVDFAIAMSPVGDIQTLMDPDASTFDKVLAGVGLVSSVIPGAGQAVKGATVAIKAGKAADKAAGAADKARDGQRASDEVDAGGVGGNGQRDAEGEDGDPGAAGPGRGGAGGGGSGGAGGSAGNGREDRDGEGDDAEGGAGGARQPAVTIRGAADAPHESAQARRLGELDGGGEFEFLGNSSQGIEGFWRPTNGPAVPTSLKDFSNTGNLRNIIGRINVNARQVSDAGHAGNALLHVTLRQSSDEVLDFINNGPIRNMPNEGVFSRLLFETADGTIEVTSAGARRIGGA